MLVTGASSGIGRALALAANAAGARVVAVARREPLLEQLREESAAPERMGVFAADLADLDGLPELAERVRTEFGTPDILVNNAGFGTWKPIDETTAAEAVEMMKLPYLAGFGLTREFLPQMLERGSGHVVNMTSLAAFLGVPGSTAYTAARWAVRGFTEGLQADLTGTGVGASLCYFSKVTSEYWQANPGSEDKIPGASRLIRVITSEQAAAIMLRGIRAGRPTIRGPLSLDLMMLVIQGFPGIARWLVRNTGYRRG